MERTLDPAMLDPISVLVFDMRCFRIHPCDIEEKEVQKFFFRKFSHINDTCNHNTHHSIKSVVDVPDDNNCVQ